MAEELGEEPWEEPLGASWLLGNLSAREGRANGAAMVSFLHSTLLPYNLGSPRAGLTGPYTGGVGALETTAILNDGTARRLVLNLPHYR